MVFGRNRTHDETTSRTATLETPNLTVSLSTVSDVAVQQQTNPSNPCSVEGQA